MMLAQGQWPVISGQWPKPTEQWPLLTGTTVLPAGLWWWPAL